MTASPIVIKGQTLRNRARKVLTGRADAMSALNAISLVSVMLMTDPSQSLRLVGCNLVWRTYYVTKGTRGAFLRCAGSRLRAFQQLRQLGDTGRNPPIARH
jgi:hypothetical protein